MATPSEANGGPLSPRLAVVFATVAYLALTIAGLGVTSLALDLDVIAVPGLGQAPGIVGMVLGGLVFAGSLRLGLRPPHPSFWTALVVALATVLAYAAGVFLGAVFTGADLAAAAAAAGGVAVSWFGVVVAAAAFVSAWGGVALVRTRSRRPRWGWERDDEE
jgi:hypothetical protein